MGSDSITANDYLYSLAATPKIFRHHDMLLGYAGSWRTGSDLRAMLREVEKPGIRGLEEVFETRDRGSEVIVLHGRAIYIMDGGHQFVRVRSSKGYTYAVIGQEAVALGSLYADHYGRDSVLTALKASEAHSPFVRKPFKILSANE
jgi:hypothetical protein